MRHSVNVVREIVDNKNTHSIPLEFPALLLGFTWLAGRPSLPLAARLEDTDLSPRHKVSHI